MPITFTSPPHRPRATLSLFEPRCGRIWPATPLFTAAAILLLASVSAPGCARVESLVAAIEGDAGDDAGGDRGAPVPPVLDGGAAGIFEIHTTSGGLGTGFLVEHHGQPFGVTAFHVVQSEEEVIAVKWKEANGNRYRLPVHGEVSYADADKDIAVLRFDDGLPADDVLGEPLVLASLADLHVAKDVESWGSPG